MQYLIVGQHPPDLCPSANETVRKLSAEGAGQIPDDMDSVREFAFQSRLGQWNTLELYQVSTLEEALTKVTELPTIYG